MDIGDGSGASRCEFSSPSGRCGPRGAGVETGRTVQPFARRFKALQAARLWPPGPRGAGVQFL